MRELRLVPRPALPEATPRPSMDFSLGGGVSTRQPSPCEHRTVSRDGRIVCQKIVDGDPEVSPNLCRECPYRQANCANLRFSLRLHAPSPLVVRFNGRTEVWDDGPPQLVLERAACTERVVPIHGPLACADCPLRQPLRDGAADSQHRRPPVTGGKVVPFPAREAVAAAG
jgi:hypothetical protein